MEFLSKNTKETKEIAIDFVEKILKKENSANIIGLYGDLGSGKTTFMKFLSESLGIKHTILSPTFVIMKFYDIGVGKFEKLIHIDAYRIDNEEDLLKLNWGDIISNPKNLVCVEWPEKILKIIPKHIKIFFEHGKNENERKIRINYEK